MSLKKCFRCKKNKQFKEFYKDKGSKDGYYSWCSECSKKYCKPYDSTKKRKKQKMNLWYQRKYNITSEERQQMLVWQNYKCAVCGLKENGKKLNIDHDHKTNQIRMLLCSGCNHGGGITDDPSLCRAKAEYLETFLVDK